MPWGQFFTYIAQFLIVFAIATIVTAMVLAAVKELRK